MKNIAITQRLIENDIYYEIRDALDIRWGSLFKELNYLPILLPTNYNFEQYFESFEINGIILSGGNDLGIWLVNKIDELTKKKELSKKRDNFEKDIIKYAIKSNIPILGICRGMQIIADYFDVKFKVVRNHVDINHKIIINNDSEYKDYLNKLDHVNSFHNYGLKNVPDGFILSAKSEDGTIEAIENKTKHIFCQMWHPERRLPFNENELNIIKKLFG